MVAYVYPYKPRNFKTYIQLKAPLTKQLKQQGLMFVQEPLTPNVGMIFFNDTPTFMRMTMTNTFIPLDMIFVKNNKILFIWKYTTPLDSSTIYTCNQITDYVIEVNAGFCDQYKLVVGDNIALKVNAPQL